MPLPLFHAAKASVAISSLDARVAVAAALAFAVAAAVIWRPELPLRSWLARTAMWRRAAHRAAIVMTALALLPAVLPYDHLLPGLHIEDKADEALHASHCHVAPGSCSDVPLASGFGEFVFNEPLVTTPAMLAVALLATTQVLRGTAPRPEVRPPQGIAAV
ncbi:MAG: hypothetical protein EPO22_14035 [Dehalococcoidia bacterium]|nr:MAG: hypothetical protein EPO22_14035 [Dehalococcoidia bacterium]